MRDALIEWLAVFAFFCFCVVLASLLFALMVDLLGLT